MINSIINWFRYLWILVKKEFLVIFNDPANRVILIAPVLLQAVLFGYAANYDVNHVNYAVLNQSKSEISIQFLAHLDGSGRFERVATLDNTNQIQDIINQRLAISVIIIPSDFEDKLNRGDSSDIQVILDGRNSATANIVGSYIGQIVNRMNSEYLGIKSPISIEMRTWYNPNQESRWGIMIALIAALSMLQTLLEVKELTKLYGPNKGCQNVSFEIYPGEVIGIVGESGSGKSTLLSTLSGRLKPDNGSVNYIHADGTIQNLYEQTEAERRQLLRTEWGFVEQNARDGLRMAVSAGANISERLMAQGVRHYGQLNETACNWLEEVEISANRVNDYPRTFSGGMQQRLQIARNLVSNPCLVFMDEPTSSLDVSVQAKLLDLIRSLVRQYNLSIILVTHDLAVARLLADRLVVMQNSQVIETGLTDQILDDPQHSYTQLLVSSILQV